MSQRNDTGLPWELTHDQTHDEAVRKANVQDLATGTESHTSNLGSMH